MAYILASASPRRRELMKLVLGDTPFAIEPARGEEPRCEGMTPDEAVQAIARKKGEEIAAAHPEDVVISADTLVYLDGTPLGKPATHEAAAEMLRALSGRSHQVRTGVCILYRGKAHTLCETTEVCFRALREAEIAGYAATEEPMDKAGAYGIQGTASRMIQGIRGDVCNVIGLPVCALYEALGSLGLLPGEDKD